MIVAPEQSTHWYKPDGEPRYGATLREARKERLYPSVTTILSIIAQPGLEAWKQEQAILAALTLPRLDNEPADAFAKRVARDAKETGLQAADVGTAIHDALERYCRDGDLVNVSGYAGVLSQAREWLDEHIDLASSRFEVSASSRAGYAGRIDLVGYDTAGVPIIVDFKSQNVKKYPKVYSKWVYQGAAYMGMDIDGWPEGPHAPRFVNLVISTNPEIQVVTAKEPTQEQLHRAWMAFSSAFNLWKHEKNYDPLQGVDGD